MKIDYKCKYCGRPGQAESDDDDSTMFQVEKWKPILACNRCADFMDQKGRLFDKIKTVCIFLIQSEKLTGDKASKIESIAREKLTTLTKSLATLACGHYRLQNVWDNEFVNMLIDQPRRWGHIAYHYVKSIKSQSETQHAAARR